MRIKLACGPDLLVSSWPGASSPTVERLLSSVRTSHPPVFTAWCDEQGRLRESLPVFVNGEHVRYRGGLQTELNDGDEGYIIPLIAGG